ncbi:hypothetical protein EVAR_42940_1 [Eumeta japonica]|uniref:FLYWCH-type domain-containing protein n=1 Tax=Eumeta variegata TaxID=151549 RepID=A0A4C1YCN0_EUMVA|nr:hypothetical protein EVAR_42940_1 [Eumeta japonica]
MAFLDKILGPRHDLNTQVKQWEKKKQFYLQPAHAPKTAHSGEHLLTAPISLVVDTYEFVRLARRRAKNEILLIGGFTFSQQHSNRHWYCSKKKIGCKARVWFNDQNQITYSYNIHTHPPPQIIFE